MANPSKKRGTAWETACVRWIKSYGQEPERRAQHGTADQGDIAWFKLGGLPAIAECKWRAGSHGKALVAKWREQTKTERDNAGALVGVLLVHQDKCGDARILENRADITLRDLLRVIDGVAGVEEFPKDLDDVWVRLDFETLGRWL